MILKNIFLYSIYSVFSMQLTHTSDLKKEKTLPNLNNLYLEYASQDVRLKLNLKNVSNYFAFKIFLDEKYVPSLSNIFISLCLSCLLSIYIVPYITMLPLISYIPQMYIPQMVLIILDILAHQFIALKIKIKIFQVFYIIYTLIKIIKLPTSVYMDFHNAYDIIYLCGLLCVFNILYALFFYIYHNNVNATFQKIMNSDWYKYIHDIIYYIIEKIITVPIPSLEQIELYILFTIPHITFMVFFVRFNSYYEIMLAYIILWILVRYLLINFLEKYEFYKIFTSVLFYNIIIVLCISFYKSIFDSVSNSIFDMIISTYKFSQISSSPINTKTIKNKDVHKDEKLHKNKDDISSSLQTSFITNETTSSNYHLLAYICILFSISILIYYSYNFYHITHTNNHQKTSTIINDNIQMITHNTATISKRKNVIYIVISTCAIFAFIVMLYKKII